MRWSFSPTNGTIFLKFSSKIGTRCQQNKQSSEKLQIPCGTKVLRFFQRSAKISSRKKKIYSRVNILWQKFATQKYCIKGLFIWRWGTPGRWGDTLRLGKKITLLYMQISYKGRLGGLPHFETFTWQNLTPPERATRSGRPGYPPWQVTPLPHRVNVIKLKWGNIWTGKLPHLSRLPQLPGVPLLHVNRP